MAVGGASGPLIGTRVHPRVNAPLSSRSVVVPAALSLAPASGGGPASARFALSIRTMRNKATAAVVMAAPFATVL
jgi:hypothetical protein